MRSGNTPPHLLRTTALAFRAFLGGEEKINAYCHDLALAGGRRMAQILGTSMLYSAKDEEEYNLNMVCTNLSVRYYCA